MENKLKQKIEQFEFFRELLFSKNWEMNLEILRFQGFFRCKCRMMRMMIQNLPSPKLTVRPCKWAIPKGN